jgi:hypothetical protein
LSDNCTVYEVVLGPQMYTIDALNREEALRLALAALVDQCHAGNVTARVYTAEEWGLGKKWQYYSDGG